MKRDKIIYWGATGLVAAAMAASGGMYLSGQPAIKEAFETIGFPVYFIPMLGIAKLLGAAALLIPVPEKIREWAYAGFAFTFIGATWLHIATQTPFIAPLILLGILGVSYWLRGRVYGESHPVMVNKAV
ncbi:MAG: DoxX family protein [Saprospiraceae bacterium]|nr:DoxX family protein [Saprospiraceae bacterium]